MYTTLVRIGRSSKIEHPRQRAATATATATVMRKSRDQTAKNYGGKSAAREATPTWRTGARSRGGGVGPPLAPCASSTPDARPEDTAARSPSYAGSSNSRDYCSASLVVCRGRRACESADPALDTSKRGSRCSKAAWEPLPFPGGAAVVETIMQCMPTVRHARDVPPGQLRCPSCRE